MERFTKGPGSLITELAEPELVHIFDEGEREVAGFLEFGQKLVDGLHLYNLFDRGVSRRRVEQEALDLPPEGRPLVALCHEVLQLALKAQSLRTFDNEQKLLNIFSLLPFIINL